MKMEIVGRVGANFVAIGRIVNSKKYGKYAKFINGKKRNLTEAQYNWCVEFVEEYDYIYNQAFIEMLSEI